MKNFILKLLLFLSPFIVVIPIWEHGLNKVSNSYSKKRQQLESVLPTAEVLVLGTSHALYGINPEYFSLKGYNAANVSQSLFYDKAITLKYLDKLTSLKFVLIDISYFSLWYQVNDGTEYWRDYFYYQFWDIKYPELKWYNVNLYSKIMLYTPQLAGAYALKDFNVDLAVNIQPNGFCNGLDIDMRNARNRIRFHDSLCKAENFKTNFEYLVTLVTDLKKHNVQPVFISLPVKLEYIEYADKRKIAVIDSTMNIFTRDYNCTYINYSQDKRFIDSDFVNTDHLNSRGAAKFSKILNEEILVNSSNSKAKQ